MQQLQQAGIWTQLLSSLFPKRLEVEVRTEVLPDGNIEIIPVYTIDGQLVPTNLLSTAKTQSILGHSVKAGADAIVVLKETGGKTSRVSKSKAASYIGELSQRGVKLRAKGKKTPPQVVHVKPEVKLQLNEDDSLQVSSQLVTPQGIVVEKPTSIQDLQRENGWFTSGDDLYRAEFSGSPHDNLILTGTEPAMLAGDDVPRLLRDVEQHRPTFSSVEKNQRLEGLSIYGDKHENWVRVSGDTEAIRLEPALVYFGKDGQPYQPTPSGIESAVASDGGGFNRIPEGWIEITPNVVQDYRQAIAELNNKIGSLDDIRGNDIPRTLTTLLEPNNFRSPWAVYFSEEVKNSHRLVDTPADTRFTLNVVESDGRALLELDPRYNHERFRLTHADVKDALSADEDWVRRGNSWVKIDRKRVEQISKEIAKHGLEQTPTGIRFPASRREEIVTIFSRLGSIEHSESYAHFLAQLADFEKIEETPLPSSLRDDIRLRSYQQHGYNWLAFLRKYGLNGILADDMGLGKTLQTLAIVRLEQERSGTRFPTLVICPTSVVTNWKQEAHKFFDGFQIRTYTGQRRERVLQEIEQKTPTLFNSSLDGRQSENFIVITSFGIAVRDQEQLSRIPWLYVIVDEAHHIKNHSAKRTRAIKTINGQYKLALTGTPIQNNLDELWSLFDFIMPGYLGSQAKFRLQYGNGRSVNWDAVHDGKTGLRRRIHPFVMRRLKEEVAKDLPEKVVIKQPIELRPAQVKLYKETLKSAEFQKLVDAVDAKGVNRASTEILAIYTRLRTICNHPALASPSNGESVRSKDSGKLEALRELIQEVHDGGHRALLFCQSTKMLDIIGRFFTKWGVEFIRLDGSTSPSSRQELVDEFNRNEALTAFLISTRAGGTGLNLTGADTVIFYDHDWNPANDNQAQDRAYRIGQTRKVTVYKLVSVGTIEEKIIERQELKQTLADQIIGADTEGFKELSKEQLLSLFQFRG